ncbi:CDP-glycerol glycerophosphotransferase family protein [Lentilactobacillus buchneri]|uniref:CDP-glycerol glycerophosphotransferase family protein n=2 Tax=Lentilactobacillus buchneri TaxID=1581 RepID=UPI0012915BAC|nr:CDP-glycerol glycerophosphotransferase family protein [Lentilactobacillus buchneri]MCT2897545.1 CDP-glycerol glycerophosphotransferase family protein [Lentilactobacillus buchneri]MDS1015667.1 CDP-glycerol glycerophosphotransferase family protein [Lentilactobacillus buchneri]MQM60421.1 CDP-glycerol glycerophosphotransferase family protein [Lentilactobacillus buchneri]MQM77516.1 CDP-glycerol glycerophosphotransferase family protein [Lentilactobacillus buchneri]MQM80109.1 CDP-glycerol glycerop
MKRSMINLIKLIARIVLIVMNDGFICMPVKKGTVLFESFNGKDVSDNPFAIYNQLIQDDPAARKRCYFSVKPSEYGRLVKQYPNIQFVKRFTPGWVKYIAKADYWVMNSRMPKWWRKNKRTTFIQTWHGTPLKKLGIDIENVEIPGSQTAEYHQEFIDEAARWDYLIAPNQYSHDIFKSAFGYSGQFLDIGYPRNDILYTENNADDIRKIKQTLFGYQPKQVMMYAPTWRDDDFSEKGKYQFTLPFDLAQFFENVDPQTLLVIRPHYLVKDNIDISGFEDRVKILADVDINQLYLITDLLITDYSSVMFDFANLKRPMLFYPYDLAHYRDQLRGFYFQYDQANLPGPMVENQTDFYQKLSEYRQTGAFTDFSDNLTRFNQKFCAWEDGQASQKVSQLILQGGYTNE